MNDHSRRRFLRIFLPGALLFPLVACVSRRGKDGQEERSFDPKYLIKTDIDRVFDASRKQVMSSLFLLAEKLYRRNPREWRKEGFSGQETAMEALRGYRDTAPKGLSGEREGEAILRAFASDYAGDRVAAMLYGLLVMADAAYEAKEEFFALDSLNAQKLYNCARNVEIAVWKLGSSRDAQGKPFLLSNEIEAGGASYNLSFEREFGRVIGQLDFIAQVVADQAGRMITRMTQSVASAFFLPVGLLK